MDVPNVIRVPYTCSECGVLAQQYSCDLLVVESLEESRYFTFCVCHYCKTKIGVEVAENYARLFLQHGAQHETIKTSKPIVEGEAIEFEKLIDKTSDDDIWAELKGAT